MERSKIGNTNKTKYFNFNIRLFVTACIVAFLTTRLHKHYLYSPRYCCCGSFFLRLYNLYWMGRSLYHIHIWHCWYLQLFRNKAKCSLSGLILKYSKTSFMITRNDVTQHELFLISMTFSMVKLLQCGLYVRCLFGIYFVYWYLVLKPSVFSTILLIICQNYYCNSPR